MYVGRTSWAYYNEIDEYAAQWIENLIRLGLVAPGVVDRRSIEDVRPDDLRGFRQCHFFAGIGVWSHALRGAGVPDDAPIWSGSCPCQPFSAAGQGGGVDDERHLWPAFFHLIDHCRPPRIYGEQVASKDGLGWLDIVLADMEASDYAIWAVDTPSAGSGAPHIRQRLRFCADDLRSSTGRLQHMSCNGWLQRRAEPSQWGAGGGCSIDILADKSGERWNGVEDSSGSGRRDGIENGGGVDRLDHLYHKGLEGLGQRYCSTTGQRQGSLRPVATAGGIDWVASGHDDAGRSNLKVGGSEERTSDGRCSAIGELANHDDHGRAAASITRLHHQEYRAQSRGGAGRPSPTNAFWRDADWLFCRDGKWRPVEPESFPLVDGSTFRMGSGSPFEGKSRQGMLKGYGNAVDAQATIDFIEATLDTVDAVVGSSMKCPCCEKEADEIERRRMNTAYVDDDSNWMISCLPCFDEMEEYWQERWDDYNRGRL